MMWRWRKRCGWIVNSDGVTGCRASVYAAQNILKIIVAFHHAWVIVVLSIRHHTHQTHPTMQETTYTNRINNDKIIVIHNGSSVEEVWVETNSDRRRNQAGSRINFQSFINLLNYWTDFNLLAK